MKDTALLIFVALLSPALNATLTAQEYKNGIEWEKPAVVVPGAMAGAPPSDATVLFDGTDASAWKNVEDWKIEDGALIVGKGTIESKQSFGDCQLHIEWSAPMPAVGTGQHRGNSGVFLMGIYEIQVLDSYQSDTYYDGQAGAIYKQTPPAVNATRPPGQWNVYDIFWTAPRFDQAGKLKSPAFITAMHNGVLILNHFELQGDTPYTRPPEYSAHAEVGPIRLQDHSHPVRFRNVWVRDFKPVAGKQVEPPFTIKDGVKTPIR
jgi:hypothetical protein